VVQQHQVLKTEKVNIKTMNRDYPLAPTFFGDKEKKVKKLEERAAKATKKAEIAVDEGRERKADRLYRKAGRLESRAVETAYRK